MFWQEITFECYRLMFQTFPIINLIFVVLLVSRSQYLILAMLLHKVVNNKLVGLRSSTFVQNSDPKCIRAHGLLNF